MRDPLLISFCVSILLVAGCSRRIMIPDQGNKQIRKELAETGLMHDQYTGFALYDPVAHHMIYQINADKYFVPASNTKIFTLYTAVSLLPDSLPALEIGATTDQVFVRGTGNPAFLHPEFRAYQHPLSALIDTTKEVRLVSAHFRDKRFGDGWAWNDYPYGYQAEKSALPVYGNLVWFKKQGDSVSVLPGWYARFFTRHSDPELPALYRDEFTNSFSYDPDRLQDTVSRQIPFSYSDYEASQLLADTLGTEVNPSYESGPASFRPAYFLPLDTVYRQLMQHSDNFIAEQLMLASAHHHLGYMQTDTMIDYAKEHLFTDAPDELFWYDGSGLSRYNMFTPRTIVWVLERLAEKKSQQWIRDVFAEGGGSGTIRNWYAADRPYVYAKTGTLRNKHCLSGYLYTRKGRFLIFSFMHNNYPGSSHAVKVKMQRILEYIRDSF